MGSVDVGEVDYAAVLVGQVNAALAVGYEALRIIDEMPRGAWIDGFGGSARGYGVCRICLYEGHGVLLVRRRAYGRHLRAHGKDHSRG